MNNKLNVTAEKLEACAEWKTCTKCGENKKVVYFSKYRNGTKAQCKLCDKAYREAKKLETPLVAEPKPSLLKRVVKWIFS